MHQTPYEAFLTQERDPQTGDYQMFTFGPDILGVTDQYSKTINPTVYSTFNYETKINDDHQIRVLAGYEQIYNKFQTLRARRETSAAPDLTEINGYSPSSEFVNFFPGHPRLPALPSPSEWAMQSLFGRINYSFKDKYLIEGNLRYDGTSKVSPQYRWGTFPSVSAGWLISKESFMQNHFDLITNLKLRASYGTLGNQDIGTYLYQNTLDVSGVNYSFDNQNLNSGAVVNVFKDQSLKWESTKILDFGIDWELKNGLFGLTFDWFRKTTFDILAAQPIPLSLGLNPPTFNNGKMRNQGIELEISHRHRIGQVYYGINGMISTAKNKVLEISVPQYGTTIIEKGVPYGAHYLYIWDGIFQEEDINDPNVPKHALNPNPKPGDLKMKDVVGHDNIVDDQDRQVVKGAYPLYTYSFGFDVSYERFHLSAFFQGVKGLKTRVTGWGVDPFAQGTAPSLKWLDAWTPENRSNTLPGIYVQGYSGVNSYQGSTYFLQDASYLRLKNVVISYDLSERILSKFGAKGLNVFLSGDNLFTITKFENGDPEAVGSILTFPPYPQAQILSLGLNVKF